MTLIKKSKAMLQVIRPELPVAAGGCVVVGQVIALGHFADPGMILSGFCLGLFISASAMVFNDLFDLEVDRINSPERPLPSGLLTKKEVIIEGAAAAVIGLLVAIGIHPIVFFLSLATWFSGFLYNWKLKTAGIWGNLIVCTSVAMTFILGGVSVGQAANPMIWIFGLIAFIFDLAEEIAGDAMDMAGDEKRASKSLAIVFGKKNALGISCLLLLLMVALTLLPLVWMPIRLSYLFPITLTDLYILFFTVKLWKSRTPQEGRSSMRALYLGACIGLVAFILGTYLW